MKWNRLPLVVAGTALLTFVACGGVGDDGGQTTEPEPPGEVDLPGDGGAPDADADDGDTAGDDGGSSSACDPSCGSGQVCCTDQHGHFPTCVDGTTCP